jgi:hypothetical protein
MESLAPAADSRLLAGLLEPVSLDDFLSRHWRIQPLLCHGPADRFSELLSWPKLNEILDHHWREIYRFRLAKQGRDLEAASYADLDGFTPRIRAKDVTELLRCGATLSFDAIDELHHPLTRLAEAFEACFRGGTKINIYAGWRAVHGLDLHRDNQEIFILQLDGRKRWLLYGSTIDAVDRGELESSSVPPRGALHDEILCPGDLLYIPRGCYHLAVPMNEPTLHLTVGVKLPREIDLLRWLVERLRAPGAAERDLPCLAGPEERTRFSDRLRGALLAGLDGDLVEQYLSETGSNLKPRPSFGLPWSATSGRLPEGDDFLVRLKVRPYLAVNGNAGDGSIAFQGHGRTYRFPRGMQWLLEALEHGASLPMSRLIETVAGQLDEETVRLFVAMLVKQDLVAIGV